MTIKRIQNICRTKYPTNHDTWVVPQSQNIHISLHLENKEGNVEDKVKKEED